MSRKSLLMIGLLVLLSMMFTACGKATTEPVLETEAVLATPTPVVEVIVVTATPQPEVVEERELVICLGQEPETLYPYGKAMLAMSHVNEAIFDGPIDTLSYDYQPVILENLPNLEDGNAVLAPVDVVAGDKVVGDDGNVYELAAGVVVRPAGCTASNCAIEYDGTSALQMDQLSATFKLLPGLVWSDGTPLTAADSVYAFNVAVDTNFVIHKETVDRTASYEAVDDVTTVWTGLPGYLDPMYYTNFWGPFPQHLWGQYTAAQLMTEVDAQGLWLGWGPYKIQEWVKGDHITVVKNENYWRAGDGLPKFDRVIYRFVGATANVNISNVLSGACDIVDQTSVLDDQAELLIDLQTHGLLDAAFVPGTLWEHIDFNIRPLEGAGFAGLDEDGDGIGPFGDVRLRQAIAMCMDRQAAVDTALYGQSVVIHSYLPPEHPLYNPDVKQWSFDVTTASSLLDAIGWLDDDNNPATPRVATGVTGVPAGTLLEFTFSTNNTPLRMKAAEVLAKSMAQCGIKVNLDYSLSYELYAPGPEGILFGRKYDLAAFAWPTSVMTPCQLYLSGNIPGNPEEMGADDQPLYPQGWDGQNLIGYSNPVFDAACTQAAQSLPGQALHGEGELEAQRIFSEELPVIPLFLHVKLAITRPDMCGFILDPTAGSEMWNIEAFDFGACAE